MKFVATITYVIAVVFLNAMFVYLPMLPAFGEHFSPADILAGSIYIVRDFAQREIKHYVLVAMLVAGAISYWTSTPSIAIASIAAFAAGELIDWLVFTFTKKPLSKRLILSATVSSPIDSVVFLAVAGHLNWFSFVLMTLGKIFGVLIIWVVWRFRYPSPDATRRPSQSHSDTITRVP